MDLLGDVSLQNHFAILENDFSRPFFCSPKFRCQQGERSETLVHGSQLSRVESMATRAPRRVVASETRPDTFERERRN